MLRMPSPALLPPRPRDRVRRPMSASMSAYCFFIFRIVSNVFFERKLSMQNAAASLYPPPTSWNASYAFTIVSRSLFAHANFALAALASSRFSSGATKGELPERPAQMVRMGSMQRWMAPKTSILPRRTSIGSLARCQPRGRRWARERRSLRLLPFRGAASPRAATAPSSTRAASAAAMASGSGGSGAEWRNSATCMRAASTRRHAFSWARRSRASPSSWPKSSYALQRMTFTWR
mmetsp:Transcript_9971/g.40375  ORF Transcript_9971/g.40375 Transcript_9971/m.40375 type:complete len:235 (+) Transcript_9971:642-1346(+)